MDGLTIDREDLKYLTEVMRQRRDGVASRMVSGDAEAAWEFDSAVRVTSVLENLLLKR